MEGTTALLHFFSFSSSNLWQYFPSLHGRKAKYELNVLKEVKGLKINKEKERMGIA